MFILSCQTPFSHNSRWNNDMVFIGKRKIFMIDDCDTYDLIDRLNEEVPFPVTLSKRVKKMWNKENIPASSSAQLKVAKLHYAGDEGGIMCKLDHPDSTNRTFFISITHINLPNSLSCFRSAERYQRRRIKRLKKLNAKTYDG